MTFEEWWEHKVLDRNIVKESKKYGIPFIKLIAENAWLTGVGETIIAPANIKKAATDCQALFEIGPNVPKPSPVIDAGDESGDSITLKRPLK